MRLRLISVALGLTTLAGCSSATNHVGVNASDFPNASGVVVLCGSKETPMKRRGDLLVAAVPIGCEGSGEVRLQFGDGRVATCPIGYVTPGAKQSFDFSLSDGGCHPLSQ